MESTAVAMNLEGSKVDTLARYDAQHYPPKQSRCDRPAEHDVRLSAKSAHLASWWMLVWSYNILQQTWSRSAEIFLNRIKRMLGVWFD